MEFEKVKKKYPTDLPIPEKQGRVRGNKNIFKVGLKSVTKIVEIGSQIKFQCPKMIWTWA